MSRFIESILYQNESLPLLSLHVDRMIQTRREVLNTSRRLDLPDLVPPDDMRKNKKVKLRILYDYKVTSIEWIPYKKAEPKAVLAIEAADIKYPFKYSNRKAFLELRKRYPDFDDLIILQNGKLTDATYSNIVLKSKNQWMTPEYPLLKGVRRKKLLEDGVVKTAALGREHLVHAEQINLVNAMMPLNDCITLSPDQVFLSVANKGFLSLSEYKAKFP